MIIGTIALLCLIGWGIVRLWRWAFATLDDTYSNGAGYYGGNGADFDYESPNDD